MTSAGRVETAHALMRSATAVRCKTGMATGRATNARLIHRVDWMTGAVHCGRVRYFAGWLCGEVSWDVAVVAASMPDRALCSRCELAERGEGFAYRFFGTGPVPLYIGSTKNVDVRKRGHELQSPLWPEVTRLESQAYPDLATARLAEAAAIKAEAPLHNKTHNVQRYRCTRAGYVPIAQAA